MTNKKIDEAFLRIKNFEVDIYALYFLLRRVTVRKKTGCWIVRGRDWSNYGQVKTKNGIISAHRFTHWAFKERIPDNLNGCHKCDVKGCINPDHIFIGTDSDNLHDAIRKGRTTSHLFELH